MFRSLSLSLYLSLSLSLSLSLCLSLSRSRSLSVDTGKKPLGLLLAHPAKGLCLFCVLEELNDLGIGVVMSCGYKTALILR